MKKVHTKKIKVEMYFTDEEFDCLIDVVITLDDKYHSNYHIDNISELPNILKDI